MFPEKLYLWLDLYPNLEGEKVVKTILKEKDNQKEALIDIIKQNPEKMKETYHKPLQMAI